MKNLLLKASEIKPKIAILISVVIALSLFIIKNSNITLIEGVTYIALICAAGMFWIFGAIAIKGIASFIAILYTASLYTDIVMNTKGNVVEPFLLTLAIALIFLAISYNKFQYGLRSRPLWTTIFVFFITIIKITLIFYDFSYLTVELISAIVSLNIITVWIYFLNNSKKTKLVKPERIEEEIIEGFKFIEFDEELNIKDKRWVESKANAYPFIYSEALKADEQGLKLVLVSKNKTSNIHDIESIELSKNRTIKYLFLEAKENTYVKSAMSSFVKELNEK